MSGLGALSWLATFLVHSTLLLGGAWLLCARGSGGRWKGPVRSERLREVVWRLALLGGVFTASLQHFLPVEPVGGSYALTRVVPAADRQADALAVNARTSPGQTQVAEPHDEGVVSPPTSGGTGTTSVQDSSARALDPANAGESRSAPSARPDTASIVLGLGLLVAAALCALPAFRLHRALGGRSPVTGGPLPELLAELVRRAGHGRRIRLTTSTRLRAPVALGVLRPEICIPERALTDLSPPLARAMLAHELAHHVRRDPLWLHVQHALCTLFFVQPMLRLAQRELVQTAEFLSDDLAAHWAGDRFDLARCLTEVAGWLAQGTAPLVLSAMVRPRNRDGLRRRVERALDRGGESERGASLAAPLGVALLWSVALGAPGFGAVDSAATATPPAPSSRSLLSSELAELEARLTALADTGAIDDPAGRAELTVLLMRASSIRRALDGLR